MIRLLTPYADRIKRVYIEGTELNILSYLTALRNFEIDEIIVRSENFEIIDVLKRINPKVIDSSDAFFDNYDLYINSAIPNIGFENVLPTKKSIIENCILII